MSGRTDQAWDHKEVELLCTLWREGIAVKEIAKKLKRGYSGVCQYAYRNRKKLGLERRGPPRVINRPETKSFDELWSGVIPCGHWTITKRWR